MLGRESNCGPEMQWAFHEKPLKSYRAAEQQQLLLVAHRWAAWGAVAWQLIATGGDWKAIGTTQIPLFQCLSLDVYVVGNRWTLHDRFGTLEAYMIRHKIGRWFTCTGISLVQIFLLFEGTTICTSRFLSPFLSIWPKGLWGYEMGMKTLHVSWKCCVVWIVNTCVRIFKASRQRHLHNVCV